MKQYDIVIIGGGISGLAAAIAVKENNIESILMIERENELGGVLNQCIHTGFGIHIFKEDLTGPEYIQKFVNKILDMKIEYKLNTTALTLNKDKVITIVNSQEGIKNIKAKAIILATGCIEKPRGSMNISLSRYAGIYTVGTAQKFINREGYLPGKEVVIFGMDQISIVMARRMVLEGAKVKSIIGFFNINSNIELILKYLNEFDIPVKLNYKIIDVQGKDRVEGITIAKINKNNEIIKESEEYISCDTLLLSAKLFPDNKLLKCGKIKISKSTFGPEINENYETSIKGIFACGNLLYIHEFIADYISKEGYNVGKNVSEYIKRLF